MTYGRLRPQPNFIISIFNFIKKKSMVFSETFDRILKFPIGIQLSKNNSISYLQSPKNLIYSKSTKRKLGDVMSIIESIILGIVQGIGEFLPISSSAHLILIPYLFNWSESGLAFDIALHFGTLLAVLVIYFKDWWSLFMGAVKKITTQKDSHENKMFWYLVVATIPGALAGLVLDDIIESFFRKQIWLIALCLAIMGLLIYLGDKWATKHYQKPTSYENITFKQALIVGCSQALAVIPGFSRSGTTILTGRLLGMSKEAITKFTFLLSVPIICGATILKLPDLIISQEVIIGIVTSFVVGVVSIKFLLKYIKNHDFSIFALYRVVLAIIIYIKLIIT